jgi:thiosulfate/3-mercaptopyruvate sulfurtransferase
MLRSVSEVRARIAAVVVALLVVAAGAAPVGAAEPAPRILVDAAWLLAHLSDPGVRVIDMRGDSLAYDAAHVPGAACLDKTAVAEQLDGVPGILADAAPMAALLRAAGVSDSSTVVVYDGSTSLWAARLLWALEYLGHEDVRVLDGGWAKWTCEALPVETGTAAPAPGDFTPRVREDRVATEGWILGKLGDPGVLLLDARSPAEYAGEEQVSDRGGHIPGAVNLEWKSMLAEDGSGAFLPVERIRGVLAAAGVTPDREVVTYCQVGGRAAHAYLALREAGYERVRLYEGSWAEWGNDPAAPIETAP